MNRYLLLVGILCAALAGCETKATKAPGGTSGASQQQKPSEPAATPTSQLSLGIPEIKPPEIAPSKIAPKVEKKAATKPEAKKSPTN